MYQFIVLGLGFLLVFGGGYLIKHTDKQGVIEQRVSDQSKAFDYAGTYLCDTDSKCSDPRTLTIVADGTFSMTTSYDNGVETNTDSGTWKKAGRGITIFITNTSTTTFDKPYSIALYAPAGDSLITFGGSNYPGWGTPIFRKQTQSEE